MPRVMLTKIIRIGDQRVQARSHGIMVREGDRLTVVDPATDNDLIRGMTQEFADRLIRDGYLTIVKEYVQ